MSSSSAVMKNLLNGWAEASANSSLTKMQKLLRVGPRGFEFQVDQGAQLRPARGAFRPRSGGRLPCQTIAACEDRLRHLLVVDEAAIDLGPTQIHGLDVVPHARRIDADLGEQRGRPGNHGRAAWSRRFLGYLHSH